MLSKEELVEVARVVKALRRLRLPVRKAKIKIPEMYHIVRPAPWMSGPYIRRVPYTYWFPTRRQKIIRALFALAASKAFNKKGTIKVDGKPLSMPAYYVKQMIKPLPKEEEPFVISRTAYFLLKQQERMLHLLGFNVSVVELLRRKRRKLIIEKVAERLREVEVEV